MNSKITPSEYQKEIFTFIEKGVGNAIVNARAGSAKTTTLVMGIEYIPEKERVIVLAFNKSISDELSRKIKKRNVYVRTFHSLGLSIIEENVEFKPEVNDYKYKTFITKNIDELSGGVYGALDKRDKADYLKNCLSLVDLSRDNFSQSFQEVVDTAEKYGLVLEGTEPYVVLDALEWGRNNLEIIDYGDMIWLPCELQMSTKKYKYDWILIDEAQDASILRQKMMDKCFKRSTRFIAFGDPKQCIYAWAGADIDAFNNFKNRDNTTEFKLPISYRCSEAVIKLAQNFVPEITPGPNALKGTVKQNVSYYEAESGDMILCRNTAPLMKLYTEYLEKDIKSYIRGSDIAKSLINYIKCTKQTQLNSSLLSEGVISTLYYYLISLLSKIIKKHGLTIEDATNTSEFASLYDTIKAIESLSKGLSTAEQLIERINNIFSDDTKEGICLSTIHKAKGTEAQNVFLLCPSLIPSKFATKQWEIESEDNLLYVAITRAKNNFCYVDEKLFSPRKAYSDASLTADIEYIIRCLINIYGTNPLTGERVNGSQRYKKPVKSQPIRQTTKKKVGAVKFSDFLKK